MSPRKCGQRGYIEQLPSGNHRAVPYAGVDLLTRRPGTSGRPSRLTTTPRRREAAERDRRGQGPNSNITVSHTIEQWLEVAKLEDTTHERVPGPDPLYILPTFGHLQDAKLDAELLERFYAWLHRCREMCTGRPAPVIPAARSRRHHPQGALSRRRESLLGVCGRPPHAALRLSDRCRQGRLPRTGPCCVATVGAAMRTLPALAHR
jgi:hypothetical protein